MPGVVTIACKLPHGIILHRSEITTVSEPVLGGGFREVKQSVRVGEGVRINGVAVPVGEAPKALMVGGYALTSGVDADFWAAWMKDHKDSDIVRNGLIFAHEKQAMVEGFAKEGAARKSGLEPLDPKNLPKNIGQRGITVGSFDGKAA